MTNPIRPKPAKSGSELRRRVLEEHAITTTAGAQMLDIAATALDQALAAEAVIKRDGMCVEGSRGPRPHPCVSISRDCRVRMLSALKSLHLELQ